MPSKKWLALLAFLFVAGCQSHEDIPSLAQPDHHAVQGTSDHDMKVDERRMMPPCGEPKPCVGDLRGTPGADEIRGEDGWDWINAQAGDDVAYGGKGATTSS
jgi:hypothetical protein